MSVIPYFRMSVIRYINIGKCLLSYKSTLLKFNYQKASIFFSGKLHSDIKFPDFTKKLRSNVKDPYIKSECSEGDRKGDSGLVLAGAAILALYGMKAEIHRYVLFMAASADVLALAKIEIKLSEIIEGRTSTFKWRGKPLFVRYRTPEEIKISESVPISELRDPATDAERCPKKNYLVVIGICTHLGCVPISDAGDYGPGGYYCPCHGSHFDAAGRIRKGPAPTNLEIPEHQFSEDIKSHTDIRVPDFTPYMRKTVKDPFAKQDNTESERKNATSLVMVAAGMVGLYGVKTEVHRYVLSMAPSADVLALAKIEIKLSELPEGKSSTFKWRGRPLFVRHRTSEEIKVSESVPLSELRDPVADSDRCPNKKYLVLIGVCTHLGCVPIADAGDYGPGGYYCPCHGSHFDGAGRVRRGPAPLNLEIPPFNLTEDTLIVG